MAHSHRVPMGLSYPGSQAVECNRIFREPRDEGNPVTRRILRHSTARIGLGSLIAQVGLAGLRKSLLKWDEKVVECGREEDPEMTCMSAASCSREESGREVS